MQHFERVHWKRTSRSKSARRPSVRPQSMLVTAPPHQLDGRRRLPAARGVQGAPRMPRAACWSQGPRETQVRRGRPPPGGDPRGSRRRTTTVTIRIPASWNCRRAPDRRPRTALAWSNLPRAGRPAIADAGRPRRGRDQGGAADGQQVRPARHDSTTRAISILAVDARRTSTLAASTSGSPKDAPCSKVVEGADVLVEDFRARHDGEMERYTATRRSRNFHPRLVLRGLPGFGADGPLGGLPGCSACSAICRLISVRNSRDR